jgi:putative endonuclease
VLSLLRLQIQSPSFLLNLSSGIPFAIQSRMGLAKRFVYILKNQNLPCRCYTGLTSDLAARVAAHNAGHCPHTAGGGQWEVDVVVEFTDEERAVAFERYLKSGSGVAFAQRHLR